MRVMLDPDENGKLQYLDRVIYIPKGVRTIEQLRKVRKGFLAFKRDPPGVTLQKNYNVPDEYPVSATFIRASVVQIYPSLQELTEKHFCDML